MCKTLEIIHSCGHAVDFYLSACLGAFASNTTSTDRPRKTCRQTPYIGVRHSNACGDCKQRDTEFRCDRFRQFALREMEAIQKRLDDPHADWRLMEKDSEELKEARRRLSTIDEINRDVMSKAKRAFPGTNDYINRRAVTSRRRLRESLLRNEVDPDLVDVRAEHKSSRDEWAWDEEASSCADICRMYVRSLSSGEEEVTERDEVVGLSSLAKSSQSTVRDTQDSWVDEAMRESVRKR